MATTHAITPNTTKFKGFFYTALLLALTVWASSISAATATNNRRTTTTTTTRNKKEKNLNDLVYREFPRRTEAEAAVLEWGHSAVIR